MTQAVHRKCGTILKDVVIVDGEHMVHVGYYCRKCDELLIDGDVYPINHENIEYRSLNYIEPE